MKEHTIISWPQSGRTWLITMIGKVFYDYMRECNLASKFSPYGFGQDIKNLGKYNLHTFPREHEEQAWLKSSEELKFDENNLYDMYKKGNIIPIKNVNCIFLVRHPRDCIVSNYNRKTKTKNPNVHYKGSLSNFIREERGSLKTMITWLNFYANKKLKNFNKFYLVRYEDLHLDTFLCLRNIIDFLGYKRINDSYIYDAIEFSKFENMKKIEQKEGNEHHIMFSKKQPFVRDGKFGKGFSYFNEQDNEFISSYIEKLNPIYNYQPHGMITLNNETLNF